MRSGKVLEECHHLIRKYIDHADNDRIFSNDLQTGNTIITNKELMHYANTIAQQEQINLNGEYHELFGIY